MKRNKKTAVESAADAITSHWPQAEDLFDKVDPYRRQFVDTVGPIAEQAYKSGAHAAHSALERVTPALDEAWDRVTPAVETARAKVQGEYLPKLNAVLAEAAGHPVAVEAAKRGRATAAALRGELELAEDKPKRGKLAKVLGVLAIAAAAGGIVVVVKKYLDSRDAEWEAPAPSTYGGSNTPKRAETSPWAAASDSASAAKPASPAAPATPAESSAAPAAASSENTAAAADATAPAADAAEESTDSRSYGAGSYVGSKPPAGFEIKGNERSKKYHTPDSPAYERTISDVWFSSTEAAEANGFTRAQR